MPRKARVLSSTGFYHVIARGNNQLILFEDSRDYYKYLEKMCEYAEELNVTVHAYCLMNNHVHLLLSDEGFALSTFMRKLGTSYSKHYNLKYIHSGHLFQDRFKSFPIDDSKRLLVTFRYILNNPVKAGICPANEYAWSSYSEYVEGDIYADSQIFRKQIGDENHLLEFLKIDTAYDKKIKEEQKTGFTLMSDAAAQSIIRKKFLVESGVEIQQWPKEKKTFALRTLKGEGLSIRQISRLTGISRGVIKRA